MRLRAALATSADRPLRGQTALALAESSTSTSRTGQKRTSGLRRLPNGSGRTIRTDGRAPVHSSLGLDRARIDRPRWTSRAGTCVHSTELLHPRTGKPADTDSLPTSSEASGMTPGCNSRILVDLSLRGPLPGMRDGFCHLKSPVRILHETLRRAQAAEPGAVPLGSRTPAGCAALGSSVRYEISVQNPIQESTSRRSITRRLQITPSATSTSRSVF